MARQRLMGGNNRIKDSRIGNNKELRGKKGEKHSFMVVIHYIAKTQANGSWPQHGVCRLIPIPSFRYGAKTSSRQPTQGHQAN